MAVALESGKAQAHVLQTGSNVTVFERRGVGRELDRFTALDPGMAEQRVLQPLGILEA